MTTRDAAEAALADRDIKDVKRSYVDEHGQNSQGALLLLFAIGF